MQQLQTGMDKENVLVIEAGHRLGENGEAFRNALLQQTGISKVSFTVNKFPGVYSPGVMRYGPSAADHFAGIYYADFDFKDVLKFGMKDGRYFSKDFPGDSTAVIINEQQQRNLDLIKQRGKKFYTVRMAPLYQSM